MNRGNDQGSATMWVLTFAALVGFMGVAATLLASGVAIHKQASAAADLSALAAASRSVTSQVSACAVAASTARANDAHLLACRLVAESIEVVVRVESRSPLLPGFSVVARAGYD